MFKVEYRSLSVLGFPKYRVGNNGEVQRWVKSRGIWKIIKPSISKYGVCVTLCHKGNRKVFGVGPLVLIAFVGPKPKGQECCHFPDADPQNNHVDNLRWGTHTENMKDRFLHGNTCSKVTPKIVRKIRRLYSTGDFTMQELADMHGLAIGTIHPMIRKRTWRYV
jgi:hypothetical protein